MNNTEITEIKKGLYKEKPKAELMFIDKDGIFYETSLKNGQVIFFRIPFTDIGDAKFSNEMESQLLIRWIN